MKPLEALGVAKRWKLDGEGASRGDDLGDDLGDELWVFEPEEAARADRLVALGVASVGGFFRRPEDPRTDVRRAAGDRVVAGRERPSGEGTGEGALALLATFARALAACEREGVSPGALSPSDFVGGVRPHVRAEPLVRAIVAASPAPPEVKSLRWAPPEHADGEPWSAAANRYVLGLVLYVHIAGEHPFDREGLRLAVQEASRRGIPPFREGVAERLVPGTESLVLAMLDPDPSRRPASAEAIAARATALLRAGEPGVARARHRAPAGVSHTGVDAPPSRDAGVASETPREHTARRGPGDGRGARRSLRTPLIAGATLAVSALLAAVATAERRDERAPTDRVVAVPAARRADVTVESCARCHARHAAEWRDSVMGHAAKSPLYGALESLIEEQIGRSASCPNGAGALRAAGGNACIDDTSGLALTGSGGEGWCIHCHAPLESVRPSVPRWDAFARAPRAGRGGVPRDGSEARAPLRDLLSEASLEGVSCIACHATVGPVSETGHGYVGNPTWVSTASGRVFGSRPEAARGLPGIGNSGFDIALATFFGGTPGAPVDAARRDPRGGAWAVVDGEPLVHQRPTAIGSAYVRSSEFCGTCHDVRLFGTDVLGARRGEHFKRLRNGYSEWRSWATEERARGRSAPDCVGCHMSTYPGVCEPDARPAGDAASGGGNEGCPPGTRFSPRPPGSFGQALAAPSARGPRPHRSHYFTSVDLPLARDIDPRRFEDARLDEDGVPLGLSFRRTMLLRHTFRFELEAPARVGTTLRIPVVLENIAAGHRVPAGFSQEREIWVELRVEDERGRVLYEVGRIDRDDEDLRDKIFERVTTRIEGTDARGRPLGLFGADVRDGPDVPAWTLVPSLASSLRRSDTSPRGGSIVERTAPAQTFEGRGLINLQNGFLRCVRCIGRIDEQGACQPLPGQERRRADRYDDGDYDLETGACRSNLVGHAALFETYFPVGSLDARRGVLKAPDAIEDTRSMPPGAPRRYVYTLPLGTHRGAIRVHARLRFRPFPPFLVRAFAAYERDRDRAGERPSGPQVDESMLARLAVVDLAEREAVVE